MLLALGVSALLLAGSTSVAQSNNANTVENANDTHQVSVFDADEDTAFIAKTALEPIKPALPKSKINTISQNVYQCVVYVRLVTGNPLIHGRAKDIVPNSTVPQVGAVVKLDESYNGHVAIVKDIKDGNLVLSEANLINSKNGGPVVNGRLIPINSSEILGYITNN